VEEFGAIVARVRPDLEVVGYDGPEPVEDGVTFAANALIKARAAAAHTGLPALADDSGVCVDVLGGAPVFSAYWAGHRKDARANLELLLDQLSDIADPHRTAQFVSTIALVVPGPTASSVRKRWKASGRAGSRPRRRAGSATTRSSCPTTRGADGRRPVGGGEERGIAPRSRLRRAGAAAEHAGAITAFIPD
jgi:XTP/dITP diphosphohydrolase